MRRGKTERAAAAAALAVLVAATCAGAVTICDVQASDEEGFSPLLGEIVTVRGVVTFPPGYIQPDYASFYVQQGDCGVNVFCFEPTIELALGDSVRIRGEVEEYVSSNTGAGATTEIFVDSPADITVLSTGNIPPEPVYLSVEEVGQEANEGRLVQTVGIVVENNFDFAMYLGDPWSGTSVQVYKSFNDSVDLSVFVPGDTLEVTGVILQYDRSSPFFDGYELVPRWQRDMKYAEPQAPSDPVFWPNARLELPTAVFRPDVGEILPISYAAPEGSRTTITVYDLQGREVTTLTDGTYEGYSTLPEFYRDGFYGVGVRGWDGRDRFKRIVPAGVYLCRLEVTEESGAVSFLTAPAIVGVKLD